MSVSCTMSQLAGDLHASHTPSRVACVELNRPLHTLHHSQQQGGNIPYHRAVLTPLSLFASLGCASELLLVLTIVCML